MPPLKGRGGPPLGGGEVRPRRQRFPLPQPAPTKNTFFAKNHKKYMLELKKTPTKAMSSLM